MSVQEAKPAKHSDKKEEPARRRPLPVPLQANLEIDKDGPVITACAPLYRQVGFFIRRRLIDNYWKPGTMLPSETDLGKELGVSQGTVRKALGEMVAENLLYRRQGLGTFVCEHNDGRALSVFFNLQRDDGTRVLPESTTLSCSVEMPSCLERDQLCLHGPAKVTRVHRIRTLDGVPTIVEMVSVPTKLFPDLGRDGTLPTQLYHHYQAAYGITVAKSFERVRAVVASEEDAGHLAVDPGTPLLEIECIAFGMDAKPLELRVSRCETSTYRFRAERG
ncbi:MAG: GntR family transcriptional regulator [Alphaproteobacteria bacterium]|nr:GntR family transcriptional regulator [Alphaproteobacteria bacterium]